MHVIGTTLVLVDVVLSIVFTPWLLLLALVLGYGFAWAGHYFFEHNRPATFGAPVWSFVSDWRMYLEVMTGKRPLRRLPR